MSIAAETAAVVSIAAETAAVVSIAAETTAECKHTQYHVFFHCAAEAVRAAGTAAGVHRPTRFSMFALQLEQPLESAHIFRPPSVTGISLREFSRRNTLRPQMPHLERLE